MLMELSIKNFAIISSLTIPFEKGLTVLTGETGAGKSIIIDAIGLLLGGRGSTEFVRYGEKRAEIEGLFSLEDNHPVLAKLESLGIDVEEGMLVLRRDMTDTGKSICRMNGKLMTIGSLREVGQTLIDVHGQHEHQSLMRTEEHLELLDSFGDASLKKALSEYGKLFKQLTIINRRIAELDRNAQDIAQKTDLYTYQLGEITQANLIPNEDVQLLADRKKLANGEKLAESLTRSYEHLYGENKGLDYLNGMLSHLEAATSLDEDLKPLYEQVSSSYYLFEEASYSIREALDQVEFNPTALEQIELRLSEIDKLKRKYGQTVEEIVDYAQKLEDELEVMENIDERVNELKVEQRALLEDLDIEANAISNMRRSVASQLEKAIKKQLQSLYMEKTTFQVQISQLSELHKNGQDQIEFLLSTNPGEPLKPLAKVASGGEISRIMLALKSIFRQSKELHPLYLMKSTLE